MYSGMRIHDGGELAHVGEVPECLDPAGRGARSDGHHMAAEATNLANALDVVGRGDRTLDDREVVRPGEHSARSLEEIGDLNLPGHGQQLVLAVQQGELAPVAR